jgi:hypothetical protein
MLALMIGSVKMAAANEDIFRQAALSMSKGPEKSREVERELISISKDAKIKAFGPIERAEVLRIFAFRKLEIGLMASALTTTAMLSVITKVDHKAMAQFIVDVYRIFNVDSPRRAAEVRDIVYTTVRETPVSPPSTRWPGRRSSRPTRSRWAVSFGPCRSGSDGVVCENHGGVVLGEAAV